MDFDSARIERRPEVRAADSSGDNSSRARTAAGVSRRRVLRLLAAGGAAAIGPGGLRGDTARRLTNQACRRVQGDRHRAAVPHAPAHRHTRANGDRRACPHGHCRAHATPSRRGHPCVGRRQAIGSTRRDRCLMACCSTRRIPEAQVELVAYMGTTGDERLISVLIEVLRAAQLGAFHPDSLGNAQEGLFQLTGERLDSWAEWAEWYARSDLTTVPGFAAWKGTHLQPHRPGLCQVLRRGRAPQHPLRGDRLGRRAPRWHSAAGIGPDGRGGERGLPRA